MNQINTYKRICVLTPTYRALIRLRNKLTKNNEGKFTISSTIQHLMNKEEKNV